MGFSWAQQLKTANSAHTVRYSDCDNICSGGIFTECENESHETFQNIIRYIGEIAGSHFAIMSTKCRFASTISIVKMNWSLDGIVCFGVAAERTQANNDQ